MHNNKTTRIISILVIMIIISIILNPTHACAASIGKITTIVKGEDTTVTIHDNGEGEKRVIDKVPLFNQGDYPYDPYGEYGTVASHGCGITSAAMVITYLKDEYFSPADLAIEFAGYNTEVGSYWTLFAAVNKAYGLEEPVQTRSWKQVREALENGHVAVSIQSPGLFTGGGHFIVLTGINEDTGKVMVNDPNGFNWAKDSTMRDGFANGFEDHHIDVSSRSYWIYPKKSVVEN